MLTLIDSSWQGKICLTQKGLDIPVGCASLLGRIRVKKKKGSYQILQSISPTARCRWILYTGPLLANICHSKKLRKSLFCLQTWKWEESNLFNLLIYVKTPGKCFYSASTYDRFPPFNQTSNWVNSRPPANQRGGAGRRRGQSAEVQEEI